MNQSELNQTYTDVCNEYIRLFTEKQGCNSHEWLNGLGSILECDLDGDKQLFCFSDIRYDIDYNVRAGVIREFMDDLCKAEFATHSYKEYLTEKYLAA